MKFLQRFLESRWPWRKFLVLEKRIDELTQDLRRERDSHIETMKSLQFAQQCHQEELTKHRETQNDLKEHKSKNQQNLEHMKKMALAMAIRAGISVSILVISVMACFGQGIGGIRNIFTTNPTPSLGSIAGPFITTNASGVPVATYNGAALTNVPGTGGSGIVTNGGSGTNNILVGPQFYGDKFLTNGGGVFTAFDSMASNNLGSVSSRGGAQINSQNLPANTKAYGLTLTNSSNNIDNTHQGYSPFLHLAGNAWDTSMANSTEMRMGVVGKSGVGPPLEVDFDYAQSGGAFVNFMNFQTSDANTGAASVEGGNNIDLLWSLFRVDAANGIVKISRNTSPAYEALRLQNNSPVGSVNTAYMSFWQRENAGSFNQTEAVDLLPVGTGAWSGPSSDSTDITFKLINAGTLAERARFTSLGQVFLTGTTNVISFGNTNSAPSGTATPTKWVSVQINGEATSYRIPLYQ